MILINLEKVFANAVINGNIEKVENILLTSDAINEVIKNFCKYHEAEKLLEFSQSFRSKGLISTVESLIEKYQNKSHLHNVDEESTRIRLTHQRNIKRNQERYLDTNIFALKALEDRKKYIQSA